MDRYVCRLGGVGYKYIVNSVKEDRAETQHVNKTDLIPDVSGIIIIIIIIIMVIFKCYFSGELIALS